MNKTLTLLGFCRGVLLPLLILFPAEAWAYIGPGAGFAFLGSAAIFLITIGLGLMTLAFWPLQWVWRRISGKRLSKKARTSRVVILGLDGLEPKLVEKYMQEGRLPHFQALRNETGLHRLATTLPPLSPVAWSTFQTGVNPGAHNIFDFLTRDKRFCLPLLSSTKTEGGGRGLRFGRFKILPPRAKIKLLRRSQPFWKVLGKYGIFSNIIRVPISYPPEKFNGNILSAMCTPDIKGTQGSFSVYTTNAHFVQNQATGGEFKLVTRHGNTIKACLEGPLDPFSKEPSPLKTPFSLELNGSSAKLHLSGQVQELKANQFSPWIAVQFTFGMQAKVEGICRFCLRQTEPEVFLYVSPININPEKPALPISHPVYFSRWLAKRNGLYGTLGLMEDTWGRNEHALDDARFLEQTYLTHAERRQMFFDALERTKEGLCVCVFDASDRIQHMFWRYLDSGHPAELESGNGFHNVIPEMYEKMDALLGETRAKLNPGDVLIVLSDHGFTSFRRGINLNTWLMQQGYLALKDPAAAPADYLQSVDWTKTRAFAIGLTGIYINRFGRERWGIVEEPALKSLKDEIIKKLEQLRDPADGKKAVSQVHDAAEQYRGIYTDEAPDLIVSPASGYRVSWESVTGGIQDEVFSDNLKAWSGDHDVAPEAVPGIFLSNWPLKADKPGIVDLAPTVLSLFAVPVPSYMEGKPLL